MLIVSILSSSDTNIKISVTIDSPRNVTWKRIIDYGQYSKWLFLGSRIIREDVTPLQRNSMIIVYPAVGTGNIATDYKILEYLSDRKIAFRNIGKIQLPLVNDQIITVECRSLPDGSSEVIWLETYHVKTLLGKVFNQFYHRHHRKAIANNALRQLKRLIESF